MTSPNMTKEEYKKLRAENKERRKHIFEFEPEVDRWVKRKALILRVVAIFSLVHGALGVIGHLLAATGANLVVLILAPFFQIFWMTLFISPRGTWRFSAVLYFLGFTNLFYNMQTYFKYYRGYVLEILFSEPISGVMFLMETIWPIMLFAIAVYLTIPKKHRQLSERADTINKADMEAFKQMQEGKFDGSMRDKAMWQAEQPTEQAAGDPENVSGENQQEE